MGIDDEVRSEDSNAKALMKDMFIYGPMEVIPESAEEYDDDVSMPNRVSDGEDNGLLDSPADENGLSKGANEIAKEDVNIGASKSNDDIIVPNRVPHQIETRESGRSLGSSIDEIGLPEWAHEKAHEKSVEKNNISASKSNVEKGHPKELTETANDAL